MVRQNFVKPSICSCHLPVNCLPPLWNLRPLLPSPYLALHMHFSCLTLWGPHSLMELLYLCSAALSCMTLCDAMNGSPEGSSVHGIFQARILQLVVISFSRGSTWPRDQTCVSCIGRWILYHWVILGVIPSQKQTKKSFQFNVVTISAF